MFLNTLFILLNGSDLFRKTVEINKLYQENFLTWNKKKENNIRVRIILKFKYYSKMFTRYK